MIYIGLVRYIKWEILRTLYKLFEMNIFRSLNPCVFDMNATNCELGSDYTMKTLITFSKKPDLLVNVTVHEVSLHYENHR